MAFSLGDAFMPEPVNLQHDDLSDRDSSEPDSVLTPEVSSSRTCSRLRLRPSVPSAVFAARCQPLS